MTPNLTLWLALLALYALLFTFYIRLWLGYRRLLRTSRALQAEAELEFALRRWFRF